MISYDLAIPIISYAVEGFLFSSWQIISFSRQFHVCKSAFFHIVLHGQW